MRIVATSDLHGFLPYVPEGDVLVICGDVMPVQDHSYKAQLDFIYGPFGDWLERQPHEVKIGVAGNHDFIFDPAFADTEALRRYIFPDAGRHYAELLPWRYLQNETLEVEGVRFHGTPWVPSYGPWAFMHADDDSAVLHAWIPLDTDVVISHGPMKGLLDLTEGQVNAGSLTLRERIAEVEPKYFFCGHIHEGYGMRQWGATLCLNVSHADRAYNSVNAAMVFDL